MHSILRAVREQHAEEGFTLIELMVVVLIIAILIAIAIPTFLGARSRAQDRQAQSNLRNGVSAAKTIFSDHQDYSEATTGSTGTLQGVEPSLSFITSSTASTKPKEISVAVADQDTTTAGSDTVYMVA
ncbi:MAG: type II secretion system protein, partial [Acidimicrobiia bacterium]